MSRKLKRILILIFVGFFLLWGGEEFLRRCIGGFAGSYPFVESWDFNVKESELIEIIKEIKIENPSLQPPNEKELTLGRDSCYCDKKEIDRELKISLTYDSTAKLPIHTQSNSFGNEENGWKEYWYYINFYYADTKEIVRTWTRPSDGESITTFAFVGLSHTNDSTDFRLINGDFWYLSNKKEINKFKKIIVDKIKAKIDKKSL